MRRYLASSPAMWELEAKTGSQLSAELTARRRRAINRFLRAMVLTAMWATVAILLIVQHFPAKAAWVKIPVTLSIYVFEVSVLLRATWLSDREGFPSQVARLIKLLEQEDKWSDSRHRAQAARLLESLARELARYPTALGLNDPQSLQTARDWLAGSVQLLREMKMWCARPTPLTRTDIIWRLTEILRCAIEDRWFEMPQGETGSVGADVSRPSAGRRLAGLLLVLATVGGIVLAAIFSSRLGSAAQVVIYICSAIAVLGLGLLGIRISDVAAVLDTASKTPHGDGSK
jgi:hypothetical protein